MGNLCWCRNIRWIADDNVKATPLKNFGKPKVPKEKLGISGWVEIAKREIGPERLDLLFDSHMDLFAENGTLGVIGTRKPLVEKIVQAFALDRREISKQEKLLRRGWEAWKSVVQNSPQWFVPQKA